MKKKLLSVVTIALLILISTLALAACAEKDNGHTHNWKDGICTICSAKEPTQELYYILNRKGEDDEGEYTVSGIGTVTDTDIAIPKSYNGLPVTSIGEGAFRDCSGLTSIMIPDSVTSIGWYAFSGCSSLASITIPDSVTSISDYTFMGCSSLTSITIPNSVTFITGRAFSGCSGLESITVASGNTKYHSSGNCLIETQSNALVRGCNNSIIPTNGSVTRIDEDAFNSCSGLLCIIIPDSVTRIAEGAFYGCSNLESITVASGNTKYHSSENCIIETQSKTLIAGCKNSIIPTNGSVTSIGDNAFSRCSSLTSITIPDSVTSIGQYAFYGCSSLTSVTIGNSITSIGYGAFSSCSSLTSVTIPNSVTSISNIAFDYCSSLTSITFQGTMEQWYAITKGNSWNRYTGKYTVYCTDGDIEK